MSRPDSIIFGRVLLNNLVVSTHSPMVGGCLVRFDINSIKKMDTQYAPENLHIIVIYVVASDIICTSLGGNSTVSSFCGQMPKISGH